MLILLAFASIFSFRICEISISILVSIPEDEINFLLEVALDNLPAVANQRVIGEFQNEVMQNENTEKWNDIWWKLRYVEQEAIEAHSADTSTSMTFDI